MLSIYQKSPPLSRGKSISDALSLKTVQSQMLERTLDGLAAGVYLVAEDARVLYVNPAAERQIASGRVLALVGQRLTAVNAASAAQLTAALREAANDKATANAGGHSIGLAAAHGQGLIATVLPLQRGQRQSFQPFAAAVAVFVQNPAVIPPLPGEAFAKLYNLTPSELRVVLALSPGLLPQDAADMLGISLATVKTHLAKVFEKTKTGRQADLVALMMRAGSPVG